MMDPEDIRHHLELGRTLLAMKERVAARSVLEHALSLPTRNRRDERCQLEVREILVMLAKTGRQRRR